MTTKPVILSIDQGTTSTRTLVFSISGDILFTAQKEFPQIYPADGWVEHNPDDLWITTLETLQKAYGFTRDQNLKVAGIGITNQRETTLVWNRKTGTCIYNAIVWQDRRTADMCRRIKTKMPETDVTAKTGLLLDPYFSATKVAWILDNVEGARDMAKSGDLAFGTVDSYIIYKLTNGATHATDATNASRTNLFNIHDQSWDTELLDLFDVPASVLPEVRDCADNYGQTHTELLGESLPILGVAGDQQAAAIGQCCFDIGAIKSTYGTGCFILINTGPTCIPSKNRLLSTIAYRLNGKTTYALEGSIFVAGAAIQWLRDELKIISDAAETENLAKSQGSNNGLYLVPAFTGLGAPHWDPEARGAIFGAAMAEDGVSPTALRVDGGMVNNDWMVQFLSDIIDLPVDRPKVMETTALGAAYLAGLQAGLYQSLSDIGGQWQRQARFNPQMNTDDRTPLLENWNAAVSKVLTR